MARVIVTKNGKQLASGQNLEVLSRYSRKHPVAKSSATRAVGGMGGTLHLWFSDGAESRVHFNSYTVLNDWLNTKRKRSGWA